MRRSRTRSALLIAVACLGMAGCEVGPNFKPPPAPADTSYVPPTTTGPTGTSNQTFKLGEDPGAQWWALFGCPPLDALVKQGLADNWSLESARQRVMQAQAGLAAAASALSPQLDLNANAAREKLAAASFGLAPGALALPAHFDLLQVGPVVTYSLDLFGATRRRIEQAAALAQAQSEGLRAGYLTLTGNIVLQVIQVARLQAQRQAMEEIIGLDRRNLNLMQTASRVGSIPDLDIASAQTQLAQDAALLPPLDQSLASSAHALAVLLGRAPGEWHTPVIRLEDLTLPLEVPVSLPSHLVHQRPDILAAEAQLRAASAQVGVATAALYPDISLSAFFNGSSLNGSSLFNPANLAWSIAAGLTQPLFDGHLRRSEQREALASYRASAADYQQTVLGAFQQVADLLAALEHDARLLAAEKGALDSASHSVELQRAAYLGGGSGILGLLDAQRQYQQASLQYVQAQAQREEDTAQLLVAMGGGSWRMDLKGADLRQ